MTTEHTMVTASRAVTGGVHPDGAVHVSRLADLTQCAVDDVRRRLELQQRPVDPRGFLVDVRVTAFVPASTS